jgi:hypothetical protein
MPPFVVFAMPRSRSAWLARFLSFGEWHCGHEELLNARSLEDVKAWLSQPCTGTVETSAAPFWRLLRRYSPPGGDDVRVVVVRRPVDEVVASFLRLPLGFSEATLVPLLRRLDAKLAQIEQRMGDVVSVTFAELGTEDGCRRVWEHVLPYPHQPAWWAACSQVNIQMDMRACVRKYRAYAPQLQKLALTAKQQTIAGMAKPDDTGLDGVTFQCEPFDVFYRDAAALFQEHLVQTEQSPDAYLSKNIPLLRMLDNAGALHVMTGRCNGRMFSYLVSVVGPSLDSPDEIMAEQTIFFADPSFPGLGLRTQRAAVADLKARAIDRVILRAGHRGSGPRLGSLFRRMGAEPFGQIYRMSLKEA